MESMTIEFKVYCMIINNEGMKNILKITFVVSLVVLLFHSCHTSQKVTIGGLPGTEIYTPEMTKLAVVGADGKVSFKISSDAYYAYLMSRNVHTNELVPFALDYKYHNFIGAKIMSFLGVSIAAVGATSCIVAGATAIGGDFDEVGAPFLAGGGGALLLGACIGGPASSRLNQTQYEHKFKYLSFQTTNQDIRFLPITDTGYRKELERKEEAIVSNPNKRSKAVSGATSSNVAKTSVSKRALGNYGNLLSGTYVGSGYLTQAGKVIEEYATIKVVVTRSDNNNVWIDVVEGGESFFSSKSLYQITKKGKNTYVLSLKEISDAYITIDANGALSYMHPKVNIDGELYTLNINAKKK